MGASEEDLPESLINCTNLKVGRQSQQRENWSPGGALLWELGRLGGWPNSKCHHPPHAGVSGFLGMRTMYEVAPWGVSRKRVLRTISRAGALNPLETDRPLNESASVRVSVWATVGRTGTAHGQGARAVQSSKSHHAWPVMMSRWFGPSGTMDGHLCWVPKQNDTVSTH
ncbi:hypothetical protein BGZ61DRAFT_49169 [Ilyonectria robusta]|uniref:uncharacterized protein n=1 Tax=Ilyonectria robusta TaxID=1079257 RepID=UPI001E8D1190|nr:uncharacterized protein BGZ61DRAFT_49169 [Ilyonectria robusta]KAH8686979.1 hypothetical protein BGZ61DRAFT_49169 [Ilyonectria robusta]